MQKWKRLAIEAAMRDCDVVTMLMSPLDDQFEMWKEITPYIKDLFPGQFHGTFNEHIESNTNNLLVLISRSDSRQLWRAIGDSEYVYRMHVCYPNCTHAIVIDTTKWSWLYRRDFENTFRWCRRRCNVNDVLHAIERRKELVAAYTGAGALINANFKPFAVPGKKKSNRWING